MSPSSLTIRAISDLFSLRAYLLPLLLLTGCEGTTDLPACTGSLDTGMHQCGLAQGEVNRYYQLYVPIDYQQQPLPLVIDLHGAGSPNLLGTQSQQLMSGFWPLSNQENFVVAWPQGLMGTWNYGRCCGLAEDVDFVERLIDEIPDLVAIDRSRIYVTGLSVGAALTHTVGCRLADKVAAIAPVAYQLTVDDGDCQPDRPIPVNYYHARQDLVVPYDGWWIIGTEAAPQVFERWGHINQCADQAQESFRQGQSWCQLATQCEANVQVEFCSLHGEISVLGGHVAYFNDDDVAVEERIWSFFQQYELPEAESP